MKARRETTLAGGETLLLRSLCVQDAAESIRVGRQTAGETPYMMREPDEWTAPLHRQQEIILSAQNDAFSLMIGAFVGGRMAGMASLRPVHTAQRARHRAGVGLAVLSEYWGRGIGTAMMHLVIDEAQKTTLEQLELDVVSTNDRAIRLYARMGFCQYGRLPRAMKYRDGSCADMVRMYLDLRRG